jgi:uncharacterized protein (DUF927 family)
MQRKFEFLITFTETRKEISVIFTRLRRHVEELRKSGFDRFEIHNRSQVVHKRDFTPQRHQKRGNFLFGNLHAFRNHKTSRRPVIAATLYRDAGRRRLLPREALL